MQDERTYLVHVEVDLDIRGRIVTDEAATTVRVKNSVCKRCSRQLGNYYEAVMQIRTAEKSLPDDIRDEIVRRVRDEVERQSKTNRQLFLTRVEEVHGGVDMYVSSMAAARAMCRELCDAYGAEFKESASLVGMTQDGQDMYRMTFLARLPPYHVGDILMLKGRPQRLQSVGRSGGRLLDLATFRETAVRRAELAELRPVLKRSELLEAAAVFSSDGEAQIVHPTKFTAVDVPVPRGARIGETVRVALIEDDVYYVPDRPLGF